MAAWCRSSWYKTLHDNCTVCIVLHLSVCLWTGRLLPGEGAMHEVCHGNKGVRHTAFVCRDKPRGPMELRCLKPAWGCRSPMRLSLNSQETFNSSLPEATQEVLINYIKAWLLCSPDCECVLCYHTSLSPFTRAVLCRFPSEASLCAQRCLSLHFSTSSFAPFHHTCMQCSFSTPPSVNVMSQPVDKYSKEKMNIAFLL